MAISLSPHQLKQALYISNTPLKPFSSSRQFATVVHGNKPDYEPLSVYHAEPPLHSSALMHDSDMDRHVPSDHLAPDLPSWTPLRTPEDESSSDSEVGELAAKRPTESATKRLARSAQATVGTAGRTLLTRGSPPTSSERLSKGKKARFDGVFIARKSLPHKRFPSGQTQSGPVPQAASSAQTFSLVDALARTFNANNYTEGQTARRSLPTSRGYDDTSTGPQTDVETIEAEDEQLQLNTRFPRTLLKRQLGRARITGTASEHSEDAVTPQDVPERPIKRLKQIQYEANPAIIDAALGTVEAPISWDAEMDFITRNDDFVVPAQMVHTDHADVRMAVDRDNISAGEGISARMAVGNEWRLPTLAGHKRPVLSPYQSRGAKFRQRLDAAFGESATVRTDRVARPRPVDLDLFTSFDEPDREPSTSVSESTGSVRSPSGAEEVASAIPSTRITSQSPDHPPSDTDLDLLPSEAAFSARAGKFDVDEGQINNWISALQRLVKGKIRVKEEDLDTLSIILAEIESVKDSLDANVSMTSELRETIRQLSELHEIPFGDRNKLRQRAANIFHAWPSAGQLVGTS